MGHDICICKRGDGCLNFLEAQEIRGDFLGAGSGCGSEFVRTAMLTQLFRSDLHRSEILVDTLHDLYGI